LSTASASSGMKLRGMLRSGMADSPYVMA
jgi:hypothetical protein